MTTHHKQPRIKPSYCVRTVEQFSKLSLTTIVCRSNGRKQSIYRNLLCYLLFHHSGLTTEAIGMLINRDKTSIGRAAKRGAKHLPEFMLHAAVQTAHLMQLADERDMTHGL